MATNYKLKQVQLYDALFKRFDKLNPGFVIPDAKGKRHYVTQDICNRTGHINNQYLLKLSNERTYGKDRVQKRIAVIFAAYLDVPLESIDFIEPKKIKSAEAKERYAIALSKAEQESYWFIEMCKWFVGHKSRFVFTDDMLED